MQTNIVSSVAIGLVLALSAWAQVKTEVEAAGFKFVGESTVLHNPADPHTKLVFDPSIRGKTDQFIYKFRKPLK